MSFFMDDTKRGIICGMATNLQIQIMSYFPLVDDGADELLEGDDGGALHGADQRLQPPTILQLILLITCIFC